MPQRDADGTDVLTAAAPLVELRLPANGQLLFLARLVAEDVAGSAEFTLDEVADLRLAVEEAVAAQARRADEGAVLECSFRCSGRMTVTVATTSSWAFPPGPDEVGWHILRAVTDSLDAWTEPAPGADGWRLCVEFAMEPFPEEP
ncbi:hypothetical protein [Amycolatopsis echigonensis]|uniref:Serine/threonine-protein kinase RsbW n=1 Tax=Amycolatopsis echigonensis TaxID=2576905 RepID=A0A8E2B317_9PSEU|nr:hypothetical protein [Amycolatopsis echigonensis]MBB2498603.1 hypothetical protein [Amycolatopsis echigonensis]